MKPWAKSFLVGLTCLLLASPASAGVQESSSLAPPLPQRSTLESLAITSPGDGAWGRVGGPGSRAYHAAVYDPFRDRMLVMGGAAFGSSADVWELKLSPTPGWNEAISTTAGPSPRYGHSAVLDSRRNRLIVFGGYRSGYFNDVWALDLGGSTGWTQLAPSGASPTPREWHSAIYDPVGDRMIVFGGDDGASRNDVWVLSLDTPAWTEVVAAGPSPSGRYGHSAIYDPARQRMIVFGGKDSGGDSNDIWQLSLSGDPGWSPLVSAGSPPMARELHTTIYDPLRDRMVLFGGQNSGYELGDLWELRLSAGPAWAQIVAAGTAPDARFGQSAVYDALHDRMIVYGGAYNDFGLPAYLGDAVTLSLGSPTWAPLLPTQTLPDSRYGHTAISDVTRDRMIVFGGSKSSSGYTNESWSMSLTHPQVWSLLAPGGIAPSPRYEHTAILDPARDRMIVFGGEANGSAFPDLWQLELSGTTTWSQIAPTGSPPAGRWGHSAIYDPVRDRMIVFGGVMATGITLNDVWELSLSGTPHWQTLPTNGSPPPPRFWHSAIYDPVGDRMIVFSGAQVGGVLLDDLWELALGGVPTWTQLFATGPNPDINEGHSAVFDPVRQRMVTFGGYRFDGVNSHYLNESWALSLTGNLEWTSLASIFGPPPGRFLHSAIYDAPRDRMVVFAGYSNLRDTWALHWGSPLAAPTQSLDDPSRAMIARIRPNPASRRAEISLVLPDRARVELVVLDIGGRSIRQLVHGWQERGPHVVSWNLASDRGVAVSPGLYFVLLRAGDASSARRVVVE